MPYVVLENEQDSQQNNGNQNSDENKASQSTDLDRKQGNNEQLPLTEFTFETASTEDKLYEEQTVENGENDKGKFEDISPDEQRVSLVAADHNVDRTYIADNALIYQSEREKPEDGKVGKISTDALVEEEKQFDAQNNSKTEDSKEMTKGKSSRIFLAFSSSRKLVAWALVGKIGPGFLVAPALFYLTVHVMLFALGIKYAGNCKSKPMMPVAMVILGMDGILKALSYTLQLIIVIQTKMKRTKAMLSLSESSILDNGLNSLYVVAVIIGSATVFSGEMTTCQPVIYEIMFYYTIVAISLLGLMFVLLFWKFIKPNNDDDFIDDKGDIK